MENSGLKIGENYKEFLQLTENPDYLNVTFDEQSSGICAVHKEHCFDKQMGPVGCRRGQYELVVAGKGIIRYGRIINLNTNHPGTLRILSVRNEEVLEMPKPSG